MMDDSGHVNYFVIHPILNGALHSHVELVAWGPVTNFHDQCTRLDFLGIAPPLRRVAIELEISLASCMH